MKNIQIYVKEVEYTLKKWNIRGVICFRISSRDGLCSTAMNLWIPLEKLSVFIILSDGINDNLWLAKKKEQLHTTEQKTFY